MTLAIIGTAGRGSDAAKLTVAHWRMMVCVGQVVMTTLGARRLVSGGSAWADHVAVQLYLDGHAPDGFTLHLPCRRLPVAEMPGAPHGCFDPDNTAGLRLNDLHERFQQTTGVDPFEQLEQVMDAANVGVTVSAGFHARNTKVAAAPTDAVLAFTFGDGPALKDGGTADTWGKYLRRFEEQARVDGLNGMPGTAQPQAFHFCLNNRRLYRL